jgi:STE24 endopeptidase
MKIGVIGHSGWFGTIVAAAILGLAALGGIPEPPGEASSAVVDGAARPYQLSPEKLAQAIALGRIRNSLHFGSELWNVGILCLLLSTGAAASMGKWAMARTHRRWLQGCIFSVLLASLIFLTSDAPVQAVGHFFSLRYRISVEPWNAWLLDEAKNLALALLVEVPLLMLVLGLQRWPWSKRLYWVWFAGATVPLMLLGTFLLPTLIEPMFDTFEPLASSHPALAGDLQRVVACTGISIPPERMFLMKASEKSNGLNAYVTGLGPSKRIVVWDTTADRMPEDEVLFTFAHEAGHYVLHHIAKGLALAAIGLFLLLGATTWTSAWMLSRWGARWRVDSLASLPGLVVLLLALAVWQMIAEPIGSSISRHFEHEADVYGQEAVHGVVADPQKTAVAAFNRLGEAYLDDPSPNAFVVFWSCDHPSIQDRAIFASQYDPWSSRGTPQFFPK